MNTLPLCESGVCKDCVKLYDFPYDMKTYKYHRIVKLHDDNTLRIPKAHEFIYDNILDNFGCPEFSKERVIYANPGQIFQN